MSAPDLPTLKPGAAGDLVAFMQGALRAWGRQRPKKELGVRRYKATGYWAAPTTLQVKHFQKVKGISCSGTYGDRTHEALWPWYTPYARQKIAVWKRAERVRRLRVGITSLARRTAGLDWIYSGPGSPSIFRRMEIVRHGLRGSQIVRNGLHEDCSSGVTGLYFAAGAPDPNGLGYPGWGFTGTIEQYGTNIDVDNALPGDFLMYGRRHTTHVAMVVNSSVAWNFGGEPRPYLKPWRYRSDLRSAQRTLH